MPSNYSFNFIGALSTTFQITFLTLMRSLFLLNTNVRIVLLLDKVYILIPSAL